MQGYPEFYQAIPQGGPTYTHASDSQMELVQPSMLHQQEMGMVKQDFHLGKLPPAYPYSQSTSSPTSVTIATSTSGGQQSPSSYIGVDPLHSPMTPLSALSSPMGGYNSKDGTSQESVFAAMQDAYLANRTSQDFGDRPPLVRMQRMSISEPIPRPQQVSNLVRAAGSEQPPRRASVVTFQPTAARPSSVPQRPRVQGTSISDSIIQRNLSTQRQMSPHQQGATRAQPSLSGDMHYQLAPPISRPIDLNQGQAEVDRLFAEVFGEYTNESAPSIPQIVHSAQQDASLDPRYPSHATSNMNFAGVLLQPEDLHMLGPDPLAPANELQPSVPMHAGWQTSFSLGASPPVGQNMKTSPSRQQLPLPLAASSADWNFSTFHGFAPIVSPPIQPNELPGRPASAPPPNDEGMEALVIPPSTQYMNRRRGSSVDSPTMLQHPMSFNDTLYTAGAPTTPPRPHPVRQTSPVYLGTGPLPSRNTLAMRRSTVGPYPMTVPRVGNGYNTPSVMQPAPSSTPPRRKSSTAVPSSPLSAKRHAARAGAARRGSAAMAPLFINFTSRDSAKLLSGVAPSGSSKRKREEEEQARTAKLAKDGMDLTYEHQREGGSSVDF